MDLVSDLERVLDLAETFMGHWESDDGMNRKEVREAQETRAAFDRARERLREAVPILSKLSPVERQVLLSMVGEIKTAVQGDPLGFDSFSKLDAEAMQRAQRFADGLAENAGALQGYLDARGCAGCGDHGHDAAMEQGAKRRKQVRKALGYTHP